MKKEFLRNCLFATMISGLAFTAACGNGEEEATGDENGEDEDDDADVEEEDYPSSVNIGTGSQGGTYYIIAGGFADLLEEHMGVTANVEVTGGPVHNIQLLDAGDVQLSMVTMGPLFEGYYGEGEWVEGDAHDDLRVTVPMYYTPFHWWSSAGTGVTSIAEHEGERVGIGPAGGTPGTYNPLIYESLGIETGDQVEAGASDMGSQMMDGQLDHIGFAAGIPIAAVTEVETQSEINIYGIDGEERDQVIEDLPFFDEFTIPAETYDQLDDDLETIGQYNFGAVQAQTNEEFVYDFVKAYHENIDQLISTHASLEEAEDPEEILRNEEYPMHSGAIRYYEEIGVDLPEEVYPPEWEEGSEENGNDNGDE